MKILHIFAPNYKVRFGGQVFLWKKIFPEWRENDIQHYVYDYDNRDMVEANRAFQFTYPKTQKKIGRIKSGIAFLWLFKYLLFNVDKFDILHVHTLRWGGLFLGLWTKIIGLSSIYESVLFDSDNPSSIMKQRFGKLKVGMLKCYKSVLAISQPLAHDYGIHGFTVFEIINPVDSNIFHPLVDQKKKIILRFQLGVPETAFVWLNVGSVRYRKGTDILVEGFIDYSKKKNSNVYLVVIGPQEKSENPSLDEEFVGKLKNLLLREGLFEKVKFVGLIEDPFLLAKYYQLSDVFVFPSRQEGLGNVVLESMASALPTVVSNLPVLENVIENDKSGMVAHLDTGFDVCNAVALIEDDKIKSQKLGKEARDTVIRNNDVGAWQKKLCDIYRMQNLSDRGVV